MKGTKTNEIFCKYFKLNNLESHELNKESNNNSTSQNTIPPGPGTKNINQMAFAQVQTKQNQCDILSNKISSQKRCNIPKIKVENESENKNISEIALNDTIINNHIQEKKRDSINNKSQIEIIARQMQNMNQTIQSMSQTMKNMDYELHNNKIIIQRMEMEKIDMNLEMKNMGNVIQRMEMEKIVNNKKMLDMGNLIQKMETEKITMSQNMKIMDYQLQINKNIIQKMNIRLEEMIRIQREKDEEIKGLRLFDKKILDKIGQIEYLINEMNKKSITDEDIKKKNKYNGTKFESIIERN